MENKDKNKHSTQMENNEEDSDIPVEEEDIKKNKSEKHHETEWRCEKCNQLNVIIYDQIDSSLCSSFCKQLYYPLNFIQSAILGIKISFKF